MRRRFRRKPKRQDIIPQMRANNAIFAPRVIVIDEEGTSHGEMPIEQARALATQRGLDLVEVSPKAVPPVCRILDHGKFHYQQAKQFRQNKVHQKKVETKGIRIGLRTDEHDLAFKKNQAEKFLRKGNKVKAEILLRGREKAHQDLARTSLQEFLKSIAVPYRVEEELKRFPGGFNTIIAPE